MNREIDKEKNEVERELNQLMEITLRMETELTSIVIEKQWFNGNRMNFLGASMQNILVRFLKKLFLINLWRIKERLGRELLF